MKRLGAVALSLGLITAACSSAEETTTSAAELSTTTTIASTTTTEAPTTTIATTTTTEALASSSDIAGPSDFAEVILSAWDNRQVEGEPDEVIFHFIYDALVRDNSNFEGEALEPAEALAAGELYCDFHEIWIDLTGIDESVTNTIQSIHGMQGIYTRVRESHAFMIAISAAGGLCGRDVWRSTADSFLAADNG